MKKNRLLLLLLMALFIVVPANAKAFIVNPAGLNCNSNNPNGVANGICYTGSSRHITFITQQGDTSVNYFCLSEHNELGPHEYPDTPNKTYTDKGYACAVHNLLSNGDIRLSDLSNGYFSFGTITGYDSNFNVSSVTGSALIYTKLQTEMWRIGENATCTPYSSETTAPTMSLTAGPLTLTDDGSYYYSKITVNKTGALQHYVIILEGAPEGTLRSSSTSAADVIAENQQISANSFYVLIPAANATNATVTVKTKYDYNVNTVSATVNEYRPVSHTANQNLGRLNLTINQAPKSIVAQVKVSLNQTIDFKVCKKDSKTNQPLAGVKFSIKSADAATTFELVTGEDGCATKENIAKAKYTISEVTAPVGYIKMKNGSKDCTNTASGTECVYNAKNTPITLKVKKLDESNQPLKDAKMQILDKDGNVFDEWTTVLEDHVVDKNIPLGKYTLREEEAPAGYIISTQIDFEIKEDGYVVGGKTKSYGEDALVTVTMVDEVTRFSVLKVNAETGEPLVGAVLRIEKEDGTVVQEEWTTTAEPKEFTKMEFGTYYLVEVSAPEGYLLQEERQPFTISQTSQDQQVVIKNVEVPNTAANKSALLISFAMLDIALGIAIILYVRKRKVTE